jgi:Fuc2NAc and GlcNAc transferase
VVPRHPQDGMSTPAWALLVAAAAFAGSLVGTRAVRRYAQQRLIDRPNERSSHVVPTPKGGGLALIAAFLAAGTVLALAGVLERRTATALLPGVAAIAVLGWVDDHRHLRNLLRFGFHIVAALWAVAWLGGVPALQVGVGTLRLGAAGWVVGVVAIVWAINLYNFMDGIDGLAAGEAVTVGGAAAVLLWIAGAPGLAAVSLAMAAAAGGFLVWNWHPARIFMGDVGSAALGYAFGVLAIASENAGAVPALAWVLLAGVFVGDATLTVLRRGVRGEPVFSAHRVHAYQRAVQGGLSHARVTGTVLLLNAVLALLAAAAVLRPALLPAALAAGALLLLVAYLRVERLMAMPDTRRVVPSGGAPVR